MYPPFQYAFNEKSACRSYNKMYSMAPLTRKVTAGVQSPFKIKGDRIQLNMEVAAVTDGIGV